MFGILKSLTKAAVGVATLPIDVVADVVTLGGVLADKGQPYTAEKVKDVLGNIKNACEPEEE